MAPLDVEALLDAAAGGGSKNQNGAVSSDAPRNGHSASDSDEYGGADGTMGIRIKGRARNGHGEHSGRSSRSRGGGGGGDDDDGFTPARSDAGSYHSSRRRSRSRDQPRRRRRNRGHGGGGRSRSRSPNRYYRPRDSRRDRDDRYSGGRDQRDRSPRGRSRDRGRDSYGRDRSRDSRRGGVANHRSPSPITAGERDRRTVFVQQLAARLRTRDLKEFFEKAGPVAEAQIVKDRVSNRSKGQVLSFLLFSFLQMCH